ncbi:gluconate:proton symporter [Ligilactobacillus salitolerans]|uniref:Gluconate:proton symporter n=1 Tax=Ligilactobacillus salitolerans TaxID=1808352 RepID=A0A401IQ01_9LACO|nr:gluconate:H+ symporter [Ligilactobacillus salitolerans]GBG93583.1 gluconate:proton symporter [Ligilactobacillus salitolerans]
MKLAIVAFAVILLIFLLVKFKLNIFISLVVTAFLTAFALQVPLARIPEFITTGIGDQLDDLAIVFGLGAMLGKLITDSGGGYRIAHTLIEHSGKKKIQVCVILAAFIFGLTLSFEASLVVLLPLVFVLANEVGIPLLALALPMATTLAVLHNLVPPHPSPTAVAGILHADLTQVISFGLLISIILILLIGPAFEHFLRKFYPQVYHKQRSLLGIGRAKKFDLENTPSFGKSILTVMMPVILIGLAGIMKYALPNNGLNKAFQFIGNANIAMLLSLIFAIFTMGISQKTSMTEIGARLEAALTQIAILLFIVGGVGAFRQILEEGGITNYIAALFTNTHLSPILAAWLITALLRVSIGSATISALTAASLVGPLLAQSGVAPVLVVLAIGAGSIFADHVNDASFWIVKEYFDLTLKETFLSWTALTAVISITGLALIYGLSLFI